MGFEMKPVKSLCGGLAFILAGCQFIPSPVPEITPPNTEEVGIPSEGENPLEPPYNPEPIPEPEQPEPEPRGDLLVSIYPGTYQVGDKFEYTGKVQSSRLEDIMIDSISGKFEWRLIKQG